MMKYAILVIGIQGSSLALLRAEDDCTTVLQYRNKYYQ